MFTVITATSCGPLVCLYLYTHISILIVHKFSCLDDMPLRNRRLYILIGRYRRRVKFAVTPSSNIFLISRVYSVECIFWFCLPYISFFLENNSRVVYQSISKRIYFHFLAESKKYYKDCLRLSLSTKGRKRRIKQTPSDAAALYWTGIAKWN